MTRLGFALLLPAAMLAQSGAGDWRTYGQNSQGWRYSDLNQIDTKSVASLAPRCRYRGGVDTLLNALDSDRDLFQAEPTLSQIRLNELVSVVQLYKALGGGWQ